MLLLKNQNTKLNKKLTTTSNMQHKTNSSIINALFKTITSNQLTTLIKHHFTTYNQPHNQPMAGINHKIGLLKPISFSMSLISRINQHMQ